MKSSTNWFSIGIGLFVLALIGWFCIFLFDEIGQAPWQFLAILIALLGAVITFAGNLNLQIRNEQRPRKVEIYEKVINFFFEVIFSQKSGHKQKTEQELVNFFIEITPDLILWGSDEVLRTYIEYRQIASNKSLNSDSNASILLFGRLILSMRKDLGHQNNNLKELTILGAFVNDIENL